MQIVRWFTWYIKTHFLWKIITKKYLEVLSAAVVIGTLRAYQMVSKRDDLCEIRIIRMQLEWIVKPNFQKNIKKTWHTVSELFSSSLTLSNLGKKFSWWYFELSFYFSWQVGISHHLKIDTRGDDWHKTLDRICWKKNKQTCHQLIFPRES